MAAKAVVLAKLRPIDGRAQDSDGLVVDLCRHSEGLPVLAAMGEREARWITETAGRAMQYFRDHRQGPHRARADAGYEQQLGKVFWPPICRGSQCPMEASCHDVLGPDIVVGANGVGT